nr:MAG TPA: DNA adenine methylase [Caudoviricetes sp.]
MRYGVPYQGSKNKIADWVVDHLPDGKTLVDLFAGGCAVTHAAILAGKWENFIINDLGDAPEVFENAVNGKYANEKRWISREDFFNLKDSDPYVSIVWSFGNNRRDYLYGKDIEPIKKAIHYARVFNDDSLMNQLKESNKNERLVSQERTENLQRLQSLQRLQRLQLDYRNVEIPQGAVVYADPPYKNTGCTGYAGEFDYSAFEKWLADVPFMVIVSEYNAPKGCVEIASTKKRQTMGTGNKGGTNTEKLFVQDRFYEYYKYIMNYQFEMQA